MNRILAVAVLSIAVPFASAAACDDPTMPPSPANAPDAQPFVDLYLGTLTGGPYPPGSHEVGRSPLDAMLGGAR